MFQVGVGSATEWDRLVAECNLDEKVGLIVSEEERGSFRVSLFLLPRDAEDYAFSRNQSERTVSLEKLILALQTARDRLLAM